jgi:hypothetical protein
VARLRINYGFILQWKTSGGQWRLVERQFDPNSSKVTDPEYISHIPGYLVVDTSVEMKNDADLFVVADPKLREGIQRALTELEDKMTNRSDLDIPQIKVGKSKWFDTTQMTCTDLESSGNDVLIGVIQSLRYVHYQDLCS